MRSYIYSGVDGEKFRADAGHDISTPFGIGSGIVKEIVAPTVVDAP
jgi:hypothetical protein